MDVSQFDRRWVAVQVHAGRELTTALGIHHRGYEEFVPNYEHRSNCAGQPVRRRALFRGYVFVRFDARNAHPLIMIPGVIRLVGIRERPIPIEDSEIKALQIATRSGKRCGPCAFLCLGQEIEIQHGPLLGVRGKLIRWKNRHRLVVSITLLKQSVAVELDSYDVAPVFGSSNHVVWSDVSANKMPQGSRMLATAVAPSIESNGHIICRMSGR